MEVVAAIFHYWDRISMGDLKAFSLLWAYRRLVRPAGKVGGLGVDMVECT